MLYASSANVWNTNKQYGFLQGKCTMHAIVQLIDQWEEAIDNKKTIHSVFFDFQKAFDLVDHQILLNKLKRFKLPEWITSWIAQYLSGRRQRVKINETTSEWAPVVAGVVQGSVLGPTLFLLFIADIDDYVDDLIQLIKFADDLLIYTIFKDLSEENIQQAVDAIVEWAKINKMKLNETRDVKLRNFIQQNSTVPKMIESTYYKLLIKNKEKKPS